MRKRMKTILVLSIVSLLTSCFLFAALSFGQEMPKPGEVIDKNNYKKYTHLFSPEFLAGFENGWEGLFKPLSITVSDPKPSPMPVKFLELSEKNRGKFTLDKDGFIIGGYNYEGFPFPELNRNDKDFAKKLMWNFAYKYEYDDVIITGTVWEHRRGEKVTWTNIGGLPGSGTGWCQYINRLVLPPKPTIKTPVGLQKSLIFFWADPPAVRNQAMLNYRYLDPRKPDDTYLFLPSIRRVLRAEAGQRSTPMLGAIEAPDDFNNFDGRIQAFNYEFIDEQMVLAIADNEPNVKDHPPWQYKTSEMSFPSKNWEVRSVYVLDVTPKDPKYPQSKKRIWIDKETLCIYYTTAWDRAGKIWKIWSAGYTRIPIPGGGVASTLSNQTARDVQFGMGTYNSFGININTSNYNYSNFVPSVLLKIGR